MSRAPRDWRRYVVIPSLLLGLAALVGLPAAGCGRTEFDTGSATAAAGTGGTTGSGLPMLPATPGLFICGTTLCQTATQQCCLGVSTAGAVSGTCLPLSAACTGASLQCDEPADCTSGGQGQAQKQANVCCAGLGAGTAASPLSLGSQCVAATACTGTTHLIVCRQDSDCHGAGLCCASEGLPTCLASCPKI